MGFAQLYKDLERSISISGKSDSLLTNYGRQLAHLALHYDCVPTELDAEQVMDYLHLVKSRGTVSATFFKFTVYGLRYACKLRGLTYEQFGLPGIDHDNKLPVVLNHEEMRRLIKSCDLLKHRLLLSLLYGCGLRCSEVRKLGVRDVDLVRGMVHVRCGKGSKDRYLPLGVLLIRGIGLYLEALRPQQWLFEGNVPGGGLTAKGIWKTARSDGKYLLNVKAMSQVFRGRFIAELKEALPLEMSRELLSALYKNNWVIYAKKPFSGAHNVVEYLGRYTHKIAISNHRITNIADGKVSFSYKDYRHGGVKKEMELEGMEFIRRFSQHILPKGFVRIRHYGILSSTSKQQNGVVIKAQLPPLAPPQAGCAAPQAYHAKQCPCCKKDTMATIMVFNRRGPPADWQAMAKDLLACIQ